MQQKWDIASIPAHAVGTGIRSTNARAAQAASPAIKSASLAPSSTALTSTSVGSFAPFWCLPRSSTQPWNMCRRTPEPHPLRQDAWTTTSSSPTALPSPCPRTLSRPSTMTAGCTSRTPTWDRLTYGSTASSAMHSSVAGCSRTNDKRQRWADHFQRLRVP